MHPPPQRVERHPLDILYFWRSGWSRADTHAMIFHHRDTARRQPRRRRYVKSLHRIAAYSLGTPGNPPPHCHTDRNTPPA